MKYLCLVYFEPAVFQGQTADEEAQLTRESLAYDDELREAGHYIVSDALQPVSAAVTVKVRNGRMSMTDGPFTETKEHLGGFILIDARDLNEAIRLAAGIPMAKLGCIEVRPIHKMTTGD